MVMKVNGEPSSLKKHQIGRSGRHFLPRATLLTASEGAVGRKEKKVGGRKNEGKETREGGSKGGGERKGEKKKGGGGEGEMKEGIHHL